MSLQSSHYGEEIEFERINPPIRGSIVSATTVIVCGPMETTTKCINPPIRGSIETGWKTRGYEYRINPPIRGSIGWKEASVTLYESINPPIRGSIV